MIPAGVARVRACFENMIEVYPAGDLRNREKGSSSTHTRFLPQMSQMPQQQSAARKVLTTQEDAYEERAAIIEYDGGLPRLLAEFLAQTLQKDYLEDMPTA